MASRSLNSGGQNPEFILREFKGMNTLDEREAIEDEEFYWCENAIPVASGKLLPVAGASAVLATVAGEVGSPSYTQNFNVTGTDYCFAVWANSGRGWIVNLGTFATTQIITGLSNQTVATQYSNQGLLIVDPFTGFFDWNLTTPSVLTPQNNTVSFGTLTVATVLTGGQLLGQNVSSSGTGGVFHTVYAVTSATLTAGGTGYAVGDVLLLTDGSPTTPAQIIVATLGASNAIATFTIATGGAYPGPQSQTLVATGPTGSVIGGATAGTGATFTIKMQGVSLTIVKPGSGYVTGDTVWDFAVAHTPPFKLTAFTLTSSGVISGTSIAVYAGRVWIGLKRTVYFTDINSYNSFGGAGGSFFIPDAYLHNNITALYAANNYLYIFGDTSVDALSNVTVSGGVTAFSRINIESSVGTSTPTSVFAYYRAIVFYHSSGFYLLSGATPEKISEKISGIIQQVTQVQSGGVSLPFAYGGQVLVKGELCAALLVSLNDIFTAGGATRAIFALYFRGRWWVASIPGVPPGGMVSVSVAGNSTLYVWQGNILVQAFSAAAAIASWLVKTKLWDGGGPLHEKQSINAALAANWAGASTSGVTVTVDTELGSSAALPVPLKGSPVGYQLDPLAANEGGSQYLGLTVAGGANVTQIRLLALRGKADREILK
jgi:hypothetical protein